MRIVIVGGGAVGTFLGLTLAGAGEDVVVIRRGAPPGLRRMAITVEGPGRASRTADLSVASTPAAVSSRPDVVVLAVKMPDLDGAIATAATWPDAPVLAVGNGVGADEMLADARTSRILAGSLTTAIELDPTTGTVHRRSRGGLGLAIVQAGDRSSPALPADRALDALAESFASGGLRVRRLDDAVAMRWSKLLANLLGNATCAILDVEPAEVYRSPRLFDLERRQLREALAVMRGLHVSPEALPGADVRPLALAARLPAALVRPVMLRMIGGGRGGKSPSLRLHLQAGGGPSEVEWLNGAVARAALRAGRRAPVNAWLAELVEECRRDPERWAWFRGHPDRLVDELPTGPGHRSATHSD
ncbi:MAG: ketopantoate reductase family protein [Candidatus Limnocylindrales bacterium]